MAGSFFIISLNCSNAFRSVSDNRRLAIKSETVSLIFWIIPRTASMSFKMPFLAFSSDAVLVGCAGSFFSWAAWAASKKGVSPFPVPAFFFPNASVMYSSKKDIGWYALYASSTRCIPSKNIRSSSRKSQGVNTVAVLYMNLFHLTI